MLRADTVGETWGAIGCVDRCVLGAEVDLVAGAIEAELDGLLSVSDVAGVQVVVSCTTAR